MNRVYKSLHKHGVDAVVPAARVTTIGHMKWPDGAERDTMRLSFGEQYREFAYHSRTSAAYPYQGVHPYMNAFFETGLAFWADGVTVFTPGGLPVFDLVPHQVSEPTDLRDYFCVYRNGVWIPGLGMHDIRRRVPAMAGMQKVREGLIEDLTVYMDMLPAGVLEFVSFSVQRDLTGVAARVPRILLAYRARADISSVTEVVANFGGPLQVPGVTEEHALLAMAYADLLLTEGQANLGIDFVLGLRQLVHITTGVVFPIATAIEKW